MTGPYDLTWICCWLPAAMFDRSQQLSFLMVALSCNMRFLIGSRTLHSKTCCNLTIFTVTELIRWPPSTQTSVWSSDPVTMFPSVRRAGRIAFFSGFLQTQTEENAAHKEFPTASGQKGHSQEDFHKSRTYPCFYNHFNTIVGSITQIRPRPQSIH